MLHSVFSYGKSILSQTQSHDVSLPEDTWNPIGHVQVTFIAMYLVEIPGMEQGPTTDNVRFSYSTKVNRLNSSTTLVHKSNSLMY